MTAAGPSWYVAQTHAEANPAPAQASPPHRVTRIVAAPPWHETGLAELARAYELLLVFTWRQIGVQYKQAVLGIGWAVLSPLLSTLVFTFVFGNLAAIPSEGLPYPLFVLSGLITWQYFARAIASGSNSIWGNSHIITKVYFPRMILPLSAVLAGLVDYVVNLTVLLLLMLFYGRTPGVELLLLPVFLALATMMGLHIRIGTEDTPWKYPNSDERLKDNLEMFNMARDIAALLGRTPATANEYRALVGKPSRT